MKWICGSLATVLCVAGCGQSMAPSGQDGPASAVFEFLEAFRTGNGERALTFLTPLARRKTAEFELVIAPPATPTASFEVGQVEYVTPNRDGAHVASRWTDIVDDEGNTRTDVVTWVLRQELEGWRIVGMVTKVYADQPPLVLDFEDPEDMVRKQQQIEETDAQPSDQLPPQQMPSATVSHPDSAVSR